MIRTIKSSILAGGCVGIAGFGYLAEKSIIGAVLITLGVVFANKQTEKVPE